MIPLDQIHFDPHQPRTNKSKSAVVDLATSIKSQGLQQPIVVNFFNKIGGKNHYYIKAGETRYRAHMHLGLTEIACILVKETYSGQRRAERILAQAAENSSRRPHTHGEIVAVVRMMIEEEARATNSSHGHIQAALEKVASAFGRSLDWAKQYRTLTNLAPELVQLLDAENDTERLNFSVGLSLARAPIPDQENLYNKALPILKRNFHLGLQLITSEARNIREGHGEVLRGKKIDQFALLIKYCNKALKQYEALANNRKANEFKQHIQFVLSKGSVPEVDELLNLLSLLHSSVEGLHQLVMAQREANYASFSVKKRQTPATATA
jgi:ParB/RepB/Spo0J family partition protein